MENIISYENIESKIIEIREQKVLIDSDVALLYGVETRDINKAVKNNPDKFPDEYIFKLNKKELENLRWKFSTANSSKRRYLPNAFTEKVLPINLLLIEPDVPAKYKKMKKEYDFSNGVRGKFYKPNLKLNLPIYLDDVSFEFVNKVAKSKKKEISFVVNQLIHSDMHIAETIQ